MPQEKILALPTDQHQQWVLSTPQSESTFGPHDHRSHRRQRSWRQIPRSLALGATGVVPYGVWGLSGWRTGRPSGDFLRVSHEKWWCFMFFWYVYQRVTWNKPISCSVMLCIEVRSHHCHHFKNVVLKKGTLRPCEGWNDALSLAAVNCIAHIALSSVCLSALLFILDLLDPLGSRQACGDKKKGVKFTGHV